MQDVKKQDKLEYVADMAEQLAKLCENDAPNAAAILCVAAELVRAGERRPVQR